MGLHLDSLIWIKLFELLLTDSLFCSSFRFYGFIRIKQRDDLLEDSLLPRSMVLDGFIWVKLRYDFVADARDCCAMVFPSFLRVKVLDHLMVDVIHVPVLDLNLGFPRIEIFDGLRAKPRRVPVHELNIWLVVQKLPLNGVGDLRDKLINVLILHGDEFFDRDSIHELINVIIGDSCDQMINIGHCCNHILAVQPL